MPSSTNGDPAPAGAAESARGLDSTLLKGLALLEWLIRRQQACRLVDVAQAFDLPRSSAHRTLRTLAAAGWVVQDGRGGGYRASLRVFELGTLVAAAGDVRSRVRPHLAALAADVGETIHLAVLDGAEIVYVDKFDSPLPVAAYSRIGGRAPAHCVASGKALLAAAGDDAAALARRLGPLAAHTPNTLTTHAALAAELQRSRQRGHAENREEWRVGVCGLGAPIFDARGDAVAAVGISLPSLRFTRIRARELAERLLACAGDASRALGFRPAVDLRPADHATPLPGVPPFPPLPTVPTVSTAPTLRSPRTLPTGSPAR